MMILLFELRNFYDFYPVFYLIWYITCYDCQIAHRLEQLTGPSVGLKFSSGLNYNHVLLSSH